MQARGTPAGVRRIEWESRCLEVGDRTLIMGVVNVTPDSFSDGGRFFNVDTAVEHARNMAAAGADIIDIGGESTRPFSVGITVQAEIDRVVPVVARLADAVSIPISIDTMKAETAEAALSAGATIVNDISALRHDPNMAALIARAEVPVVLMHMKGTPETMQVNPAYTDVMADILSFFEQVVETAVAAGIPSGRIVADPGIGFGKTVDHNFEILARLRELQALGLPILVGPSRKSFLRHTVKPAGAKDLDPAAPAVETGTQAAVAAAILNGAHIVRVHDVPNTVATVKIIDRIRRSGHYPETGPALTDAHETPP
jgi:dihydropteroate synthase